MRAGDDGPAREGSSRGRLPAARLAAICLAACLALPGCAGTGAPADMPPAEEALANVFGCWIDLQAKGEGGAQDEGERIQGEFLAVGPDTVYVLAADTLWAVGRSRVQKAKLVLYAPQLGGIAGWGAAGMISTLSHGAGFILSLPVWIVTTIATHHAGRNMALARHPLEDWEQLSRFARFPQGPPPALRTLGLQPPAYLTAPAKPLPPPGRGA